MNTEITITDFKTCPSCQNPFISSHKHRKYCSDECFKSARKTYENALSRDHYRKNKTCKHCGIEVQSVKKDLYSGGCCKNPECIEKEKLLRQRKSRLKWYNANFARKSPTKLESREISKRYRQNNKSKIKFRLVQRLNWFETFKKTQRCVKCSENRHYCLDFHHTDGEKEYGISKMIRMGLSAERMESELKKCVALCANCHREWHYFKKSNQSFTWDQWLCSSGNSNHTNQNAPQT